jgi:hypothetical protein
MALFRNRRPVRLLPGPRLSLSQATARASSESGLRGTHATFDRRAHRTPIDTRAARNGFDKENERSMSDPRKQQTSAVSLLIAAVVALWLVLFLMGHR